MLVKDLNYQKMKEEFEKPPKDVLFWINFSKKWIGDNSFWRIFFLLRGQAILGITLPAIIIGTLISPSFDIKIFLSILVGLLSAHAASNVINDWWDAKLKIDVPEYYRNKYSPHPFYELGEKKSLILGLLLSFISFLSGFYIFLQKGFPILVFAFLGFFFIFFYSGKPLSLKYKGLGDISVFLVWGPIMICGIYYSFEGRLKIEPFLASLPYGISAFLIVLGKHLDKLSEDVKKGVKTLPIILGEKRAKILFKISIILKYLFVLFLIPYYNFAFLTFLHIGRDIKAIKLIDFPMPKIEELPDYYPRELYPMWYVGGAFILNFGFSFFYSLSLLISRWLS